MTVWWEKFDKNPPVNATEWKGAKVNGVEYTAEGNTLAHPNSRFTAPAENCPCISPEFNNPKGVPVSAIIFGGRRASTTPLVYQSFDWTHGTYMGSAVSSETTAAATGAVGVLRHDPMAMKPFIGYNVGDYWAHWLEMGEILGDKAPKIFNVNWFKQDENGNFMWPGFGDNMRVLDWIIKRCEGTVDAVETAIGYLPKKEDINLEGIQDEVTPEVLDKLLAVDKDLWKAEIAEMRRYYNDDIKAKGGNIPQALYDQLDKIEANLNK
jgi:phosphoenolpyruvate carboxykinase (GTP)